MRKKWLLIPLLLFLCGCISSEATRQAYTPFIPTEEIKDRTVLLRDIGTCRLYALQWLHNQPGIDPKQIVQVGLESGLNGLSYVAVSPVAPAYAGVGGAGSEVLKEMGYNSEAVKHIITNCLHDKGMKSGAYSVYPEF